MSNSLEHKLKLSLKQALLNHSNLFEKPEVLLWPDPDKQWTPIVPELQKSIKELLILGDYKPENRQGPAIYIKCMVSRTLPQANWPEGTIPILYMPGFSKSDIKNITSADLVLQPLMEYQFTGTMWVQENGKEWTINAFLQNKTEGLNLSVAQDYSTKEMLKKALPSFFKESESLKLRGHIDADYLNSIVFPEFIPVLLKWLCKGDEYLNQMDKEKQNIFKNICTIRYGIEANYSIIKDIIQKLATRKGNWEAVWQYYANSPKKFAEIEQWLRQLPAPVSSLWNSDLDLETWPQINEDKEGELRKALLSIGSLNLIEALSTIERLEEQHSFRRRTVWAELGKAQLTFSLMFLKKMAECLANPYPSKSIDELKEYYLSTGYIVDTMMRNAYLNAKCEEDKEAVKTVINAIYKPWLEKITNKFQQLLLEQGGTPDEEFTLGKDQFVIFVDAFRYELAMDFLSNNMDSSWLHEVKCYYSPLPSLTPTAKPYFSFVKSEVLNGSQCNEFRPQLKDGKELTPYSFKNVIENKKIRFITNKNEIAAGETHYMEYGEIDRKGHEEQAELIGRIPEQLNHLKEIIEGVFASGINKIKIVTDHGWLLLPGGLPKATLSRDLTETRWGRCAIVKEGVKTNFLYFPWHWNPAIHVAYAPGISFFKKNEEYAHGGISLQECIVPIITIEKKQETKRNLKITSAKWVNLRCVVEVKDAYEGCTIDIRKVYTDPSSSVVLSQNKVLKDGTCTVFVDDEAENHSVAIVLLNENGIIIDKQIGIVGN